MKIGRNDPCHCQSNKKYKKCCMNKDVNFNNKLTDVFKTITSPIDFKHKNS